MPLLKISIVTATWNSAATVADTLASVNAQTHPDVEQIIVDGGSSDATLTIVRAQGRRVSRLVSERDDGIYDAMNKGLSLASGDVVGLLNSDDFLASPDVLATVADAFADPSVDAVYGDLCYVRQHAPEQVVRYWRSGPFRAGAFARGWSPPHPTLYVRKSFYDEHGGFDTSYSIAADIDLMVRFFEVYGLRSVHLRKVLVGMRLGGASNKSVATILKQNREIWHSLREHGLGASLPVFVLRKLASRTRQFIARPEPS
jgi:glycosyltransferase involved in cell wall biosynthesis